MENINIRSLPGVDIYLNALAGKTITVWKRPDQISTINGGELPYHIRTITVGEFSDQIRKAMDSLEMMFRRQNDDVFLEPRAGTITVGKISDQIDNAMAKIRERGEEITNQQMLLIHDMENLLKAALAELGSFDFIDKVKPNIHDEKEEIQQYQNLLCFAEKQLKDGLSLSDYFLKYPLLLQHNRIRLFVRTLTGKTITFDMEKSDTIYKLKIKILMKEGVPVHEQRLIFDSEQLKDERTLGDCNISNQSIIFCVLRLRGGCGEQMRLSFGDELLLEESTLRLVLILLILIFKVLHVMLVRGYI